MELNKTIEKITKYLPFGSMHHFLDREKTSKYDLLKFIGHSVYATTALIATFIAPIIIFSTGEYSLRPREVLRATAVKHEAELERRDELVDKILGENGYADLNKDGRISLVEQVDAWKRMGLDTKTSSRAVIFPSPTLEQLEKAERSYENQSRQP